MIVLVYNAKNDKISKAFDVLHKMVSPSTYQCDLCKLTHGNFGATAEWKAFLNSNTVQVFYKDNFLKTHPKHDVESQDFPLIIYKAKDTLKVLINKEELETISDTKALIEKIKQKISANSY